MIKSGRVVGPDDIPIDVWRMMGERGITWVQIYLILCGEARRCQRNGGKVLWYLYTRTRVIYKIVPTIEVLS